MVFVLHQYLVVLLVLCVLKGFSRAKCISKPGPPSLLTVANDKMLPLNYKHPEEDLLGSNPNVLIILIKWEHFSLATVCWLQIFSYSLGHCPGFGCVCSNSAMTATSKRMINTRNFTIKPFS